MAEEEISYRFLRKIQQMEKNSPMLTELQSSFYDDIKTYLSDLNTRIEGESDSNKIKLLEDEISNTNKIIISVFEQREKKILLAAISKARGGNPDLKNLLDVEIVFFNSILNLIDSFRDSFLKFKKKTEKQYIESLGKKNSNIETKEVKIEVESKKVSINKAIYRVINDVPEFIGTDTKKYYLRKNDVLSMPEDMGEMLSKRKVVEKLEL